MFFRKIFNHNDSKNIKEKEIIEKHYKILIVDDAYINRYVLKKFINRKNKNIIIEEAENGLDALNMCRDTDYDIIFMDIKMPIMDGNESAIRIKKIKNWVKIYGVTGQVYENDLKESIKSGMDLCLAKPVKYSDVENIIVNFYNM